MISDSYFGQLLQKDRHKNRKNGKDLEVLTEVPVDMIGSSQIGNIEFNIEVADQTPEPLQMAPELPVIDEANKGRRKKNRNQSNAKGLKNYQNLDEESVSPNNTQETTTEDIFNETTDEDTNASPGKPTDSEPTAGTSDDDDDDDETTEETMPPMPPMPPAPPQPTNQPPNEKPTFKTTPTAGGGGNAPIWPIILVVIVFNVLILMGIIWY